MSNFMKVEFAALAENEAFARAAVAAFIMPLDPTVEELTEIKTAVSEAVSNSIIHGYASKIEDAAGTQADMPVVVMECVLHKNKLTIKIKDDGVGIYDVKQAMEPLYTTGNSEERSGMGFTVMESFMDKLLVNSEIGKGTTIIMTKYLDIIGGY